MISKFKEVWVKTDTYCADNGVSLRDLDGPEFMDIADLCGVSNGYIEIIVKFRRKFHFTGLC